MTVEFSGNLKPLVFGEVLFDQFEDSSHTLGGAPFNVACHLNGFGVAPFFVSRIGNDKNGVQVRHTLHQWGIASVGLQIDAELPTGIVHVTLRDTIPSFDIPSNQAWDQIEYLDSIPQGVGLLYHGSLALRSRKNQETICMLCEKLNPYIFVDLNLRAPWWEHTVVQQIIHRASSVKLSLEELNEVLERPASSSFKDSVDLARYVCDRYGLQFMIVTMGKDGSALFEPGGKVTHFESVTVQKMQDTVGAGDAFCAVIILGILKKWKLEDAMCRASEFAARICSIQGAVLFDKELYQEFLSKW